MSTWIQTRTGRKFHPFEPFRNEYPIEDIAHALSNICRFGGHTSAFYSVAQHSVLVSLHVQDEYAKWGLLHDAAEAFFGDVQRPIKKVLPDYQAAEHRTGLLIADAFGVQIDDATAYAVHVVDQFVVVDEAVAFMSPLHPDFRTEVKGPGLGLKIDPLPPDQAKAAFLARFAALWPERRKEVARVFFHGNHS